MKRKLLEEINTDSSFVDLFFKSETKRLYIPLQDKQNRLINHHSIFNNLFNSFNIFHFNKNILYFIIL